MSGIDARELKPLAVVLPSISAIVFALVVTLPWGLPSEATYAPPLMVLGLIFAWTARFPQLMPSIVVFLIGFTVDVLSNSPIGFWALLFLAGYGCARRVAALDLNWPVITGFIAFLPTVLAIAALAWCIASVYFVQLIDWRPLANGVWIAVIAFPVFALVLRSLERLMVRQRPSASGAGSAA